MKKFTKEQIEDLKKIQKSIIKNKYTAYYGIMREHKVWDVVPSEADGRAIVHEDTDFKTMKEAYKHLEEMDMVSGISVEFDKENNRIIVTCEDGKKIELDNLEDVNNVLLLPENGYELCFWKYKKRIEQNVIFLTEEEAEQYIKTLHSGKPEIWFMYNKYSDQLDCVFSFLKQFDFDSIATQEEEKPLEPLPEKPGPIRIQGGSNYTV